MNCCCHTMQWLFSHSTESKKNKNKMLCLNLHPWGFAHRKASGSKRFSYASFNLHQNSLNLATEIKVFLSSKPISVPVPLISSIIQSLQNVMVFGFPWLFNIERGEGGQDPELNWKLWKKVQYYSFCLQFDDWMPYKEVRKLSEKGFWTKELRNPD